MSILDRMLREGFSLSQCRKPCKTQVCKVFQAEVTEVQAPCSWNEPGVSEEFPKVNRPGMSRVRAARLEVRAERWAGHRSCREAWARSLFFSILSGVESY